MAALHVVELELFQVILEKVQVIFFFQVILLFIFLQINDVYITHTKVIHNLHFRRNLLLPKFWPLGSRRVA